MRSSSRRPTGLSARAVTMAVLRPKQRRRPRATLYSPPPSHTLNWRAVATRTSPGSRRSMTSPSETRSHLQSSFLRSTRLFLLGVALIESSCSLRRWVGKHVPAAKAGVLRRWLGGGTKVPPYLRREWESSAILSKVADSYGVHVGVVLVLSAHAPAEAIALGADAGVNGPARRYDDLLVRHDDVAGRVGWAHEVHDALVGLDVEVEVDFGAAHMGVRGHGVPVAAGGEEGEAHDQLAALDAVAVNRLVDGALVAGLGRSEIDALEVGELDHLGGVFGVGLIAEEVEGRGLGGGLAGEADGLAAAACVEAVEFVEIEGDAIDAYGAGGAGGR